MAATASQETPEFFFTVCIPAFNRGHLLPRLFESIRTQTFKDFEVVVVDDGSTDDTRTVVAEFRKEAPFPVHYVFQENAGKPSATNAGVDAASGFMFVIADSDDLLPPLCLETMHKAWQAVPDKAKCAGVLGLTSFLHDPGKVIGQAFPEEGMLMNHAEMLLSYGITGGKMQGVRSDLMRRFRPRLFPGEKFIRESDLWHRLGLSHKFVCVNEILRICEFQPGGLSSQGMDAVLQNPRGSAAYHRQLVDDILPTVDASLWTKVRVRGNRLRFALHARRDVGGALRSRGDFLQRAGGMAVGLALYLKDQLFAQARRFR